MPRSNRVSQTAQIRSQKRVGPKPEPSSQRPQSSGILIRWKASGAGARVGGLPEMGALICA